MKLTTTVTMHVRVGGRRTTVTMDILISDLLAAHLGVDLGAGLAGVDIYARHNGSSPTRVPAWPEVRKWVQAAIDEAGDWDEMPERDISQWISRRALLAVARVELVRRLPPRE